jgi:hypothetical protein
VKAAGIERFGGDVRELSLPDPRPAGAGETLITVRAAGVAPWDDIVRLGSWDVGPRPPMALGVARGLLTRVILEALELNDAGRLWSIDLPPFLVPGAARESAAAVSDICDIDGRSCGVQVGDCSRTSLPIPVVSISSFTTAATRRETSASSSSRCGRCWHPVAW